MGSELLDTLTDQPVDAAGVSSILVIQFRYLGDVVLGMSLLDNLRRHYPDAHLSILSDAGNAALFALKPDVEFIAYHGGRRGSRNPFRAAGEWARSVRALRSRRIDLLIDCSRSRTGAILATLSRARIRVGYRPDKWAPSRAYTHFATDWGRGRHYLDRFLSPLQALGLPVVRREPQLHASTQTQDRIARLLVKEGLEPKAFFAVHLGARVPSRQWPLENFAHVIDAISSRYGMRAVLIGGPDERQLANIVCGLSRSTPLHLAGTISLEELVACLAGCRFFLGNDSGPMHIAAAAGAPVVALFGWQFPEQWGPVGDGHVILRPCPFPDICEPPNPQATLCVRRILPAEVVDAVAAVIRDA